MATFVTGLETHQFLAYRDEVILKAQQEVSKLEGTAITVPLVGEMTSLDAYGEIAWYAREQAGEPNKVQVIERDRRWIASEHFASTQRWERTEDHKNLHRFEPNGTSMRATMAAWGRKKDELFWAAFAADVAYGPKGTLLQSLPAAQILDNTIKEQDTEATTGVSATGASGDVVIESSTEQGYGTLDSDEVVGLNMGKVRAAQQLLLDQDVDDEMIHVACHSRQINDLLNSSRFTEMDNESMTDLSRLGKRTGNTFYGMTWHRTTQATQHTAGFRYVYFYTDRAMVGGKVNGSESVNLDELVGNHHMRQLAIYADYGAIRRIDEEVVQVDNADNWG